MFTTRGIYTSRTFGTLAYNLKHFKFTSINLICVTPLWRPVATFVHPQRSTQQQVTCMPTWHTCTCHHSVTWYLKCHAGIPALRRCAPYTCSEQRTLNGALVYTRLTHKIYPSPETSVRLSLIDVCVGELCCSTISTQLKP